MKKLLLGFIFCFAISGIAMATVNINTATKEELVSLKGIGEKRAQDIIDYRTKNGPFKTVDDLEKVKGIGPGILKQIRSEISVTGKTVIAPPAEKTSKGKVSGAAKTGKGTVAKSTEPAKGETLKAEKAKAKVTEKSKTDAAPAAAAKAQKESDEKTPSAKKKADAKP